jgi:tape measure domain-containing protein
MKDLKIAIKLDVDGKQAIGELTVAGDHIKGLAADLKTASATAASSSSATAKAVGSVTASLGQAKAASQSFTSEVNAAGEAAVKSSTAAINSFRGFAVTIGQAKDWTKSFATEMKAAGEVTVRSTTSAARGVRSISEQLGKAEVAIKSYFTAQAATAGIRWITDQTSELRQLEGRLRTVTSSAEDYDRVFSGIFTQSNRWGTDVTETASAFARLNPTIQTLGGNSQITMRMLDGLSASARLSGATAAENSSLMRQFSQAMGSGRVNGDEFNSMMENAQPLMRAIGQQLGKTTGELRLMAEEGKLTSSVFANAMLPAIDSLVAKAGMIPPTLGQASQALRNNALKDFGREFASTGDAITRAMQFAADHTLEAAAAAKALVDTLVVVAEKAAIVAGGAALGAMVITLGAATTATTGLATGLTAVNGLTVALATGAAMRKLETLSKIGKAGLLGLVFWGAYELTDFITSLGNVRSAIVDLLTPVFDAYDKVTGTQQRKAQLSAEEAQQRLAQLRAAKAAGQAGEYVQTELLGTRSNKFVPIDSLISQAEGDAKRLQAAYDSYFMAPARAANAATAPTRLSAAGEYEGLTKDLKYREKIVAEYNTKLLNLQQAFADKYADTKSDSARSALQERQKKELAALLLERKAALEGAGDYKAAQEAAKTNLAETIGLYEQQQVEAARIFNDGQKELDARHKAGLVADRDYYEKKTAIALEANLGQQTLVQQELDAVKRSGLSDKEKLAAIIKYNAELKKLRGEAASIESDETKRVLIDAEVRKKAMAELSRVQQQEFDDELAQDYARRDELRAKSRLTLDEWGAAVRRSNEQTQFEHSIAMLSERDRAIAIAQFEAELRLKKQIADIDKNQGYESEDQREEDRQAARRIAFDETLGAASRAQVDQFRNTVKTIDSTFKDGFRAMLNRGEGAWKSWVKSLKDTFKATLADWLYEQFARPFVMQIVGSFLGMTGMPGALAALGGGQGGAGGALGLISNGASLYKAASSLMNGTGASIANLWGGGAGGSFASSVGGGFATDAMGATVSAGSSGATLGGGISGAMGAMMNVVPWAMVIAAAASLFSDSLGEERTGGQYAYSFDGKQAYNPRRGTFTAADGKGATFLEGPSGGVVKDDKGNDLVKPLINSTVANINQLFSDLGTGITLTSFQAGVESSDKARGGIYSGGTLSTGQTFGEAGTGSNYQNMQGTQPLFEQWMQNGVFTTSLSPEEAAKAFGIDMQGVVIQALQASANMGPKTVVNQEDTWQQSGEDNGYFQTRDVFTQVFDDTALELETLPKTIRDWIRGFNVEGAKDEEVTALFTKINKAVQDVAGLTQLLNALPIDYLTKASFDAKHALIELSGGLDALKTNLGSYIQNFYSEDERRAQAVKNMGASFAALGVPMIDLSQGSEAARAAFRGLVDGQDLTTASGQKTYAGLLAIAGAFAELTPLAEAAADALDSVKNATDEAFDVLQNAVERQRTLAEASRDAAQESVDALSSVFDLLKTQSASLYGQVDSTAARSAARGRAFIDQALLTAQTTGYMPDSGDLSDAIGAARSGLNPDEYSSQADFNRDTLKLAGKLETLKGLAGTQLTSAQLQLKAAEDQLDALDGILKLAKDSLEEARGTREGVMTLAEATTAYYAKIEAEKAAAKKPAGATAKPGGAVFGGGGAAPDAPGASTAKYRRSVSLGTAGWQNQDVIDPTEIASLDALKTLYHTFDNTGNLRGLLEAVKGAGYRLTDLQTITGFPYSDWLAAANSVDFPAFREGGSHRGGGRWVGEAGPELEFTGPSQIYSNADSMVMLSNGANLATQVQNLQATVEILIEAVREGNVDTQRTRECLEKVTDFGNEMRVATV